MTMTKYNKIAQNRQQMQQRNYKYRRCNLHTELRFIFNPGLI